MSRLYWDTSRGNQLRWLEEDLQRSNAVWNIVYVHKPPFSSGNNAATQVAENCPGVMVLRNPEGPV